MIDRKTFLSRLKDYERQFRTFVRTSQSGLDDTLFDFWNSLTALPIPFEMVTDEDMAQFSFGFKKGFHITTNRRRFHRPKKTGKPRSVTIIMSGLKEEYEDPEDLLVPCDYARKIECCYFGMAEDEAELAMFFIQQMITRAVNGRKAMKR